MLQREVSKHTVDSKSRHSKVAEYLRAIAPKGIIINRKKMQLLQRVLVLAFCVAMAYILPATLADNEPSLLRENALYNMVLAQARSAAMIEPRAEATPGETACAMEYNDDLAVINKVLFNKTNVCFENTNKTNSVNTANENKTISSVRSNLLDVQVQIANCSNFTDTNLFLNCTTATFQSNLIHLDRANNLAYQAQMEIALNLNQMVLVQEACINSAVDEAKINQTLAANDYSHCLKNIKNQRVLLGIN